MRDGCVEWSHFEFVMRKIPLIKHNVEGLKKLKQNSHVVFFVVCRIFDLRIAQMMTIKEEAEKELTPNMRSYMRKDLKISDRYANLTVVL